ncbi:MAG: biotin--[acetyl-CoA-carboxylase] ligase [Phycisphaerae bacterium]|nr:biotin--[acetyl-CoA-carboxylase] ligase [Phycisphaerae bacterium]
MTPRTIIDWPAAIETALCSCTIFTSVRVLADTDSTQDAARALSKAPGVVIVAWRQRHGRGRHGRTWSDTGEQGVAVTFVAPSCAVAHLAAASAVATARAIEQFTGAPAGIKWPNDIVVDGQKLAGILVERVDGVALIGIGINVGQTEFSPELTGRATSMQLLGVEADRLDVVTALVPALDRALQMQAEELSNQYAERDALRGAIARLSTMNGEVEGRILRANPFEGVILQTSGAARTLPPETTAVLSWQHVGYQDKPALMDRPPASR